jgi:uncharacterized protein involved in type VI secretion and phage assembly
MMNGGFYGKYRGKVESNSDPMKLGRLKVSCPAVLGAGKSSWALPCTPYAGKKVGFFAMPPEGANIWVEFEGGDPDYPIWSGCFWGKDEAPVQKPTADVKVWKTDGITLTLDDTQGSVAFTLELKSPALKMTFDSKGIELKNSSSTVKLTTSSVSINDGALEVV